MNSTKPESHLDDLSSPACKKSKVSDEADAVHPRILAVTSPEEPSNVDHEKNGKDCNDSKEDSLQPEESSFLNSLEPFQVKEVLSNSADMKRVVVSGRIKEDAAIAILEKKPFVNDSFSLLFSSESKLKHVFQNNIYVSYTCYPSEEIGAPEGDIAIDYFSELKTTLIHPATEKHIDKYRVHKMHIVQETPKLYNDVVLPYLSSRSFDITWVHNILQHKTETERILFENNDPKDGFILLPDLKWDGKTLENLYLVAIAHCSGIKSLRDLNESHLPLLENILNQGSEAITKAFSLQKTQQRIYLHYQPSYYHLHVHFTSLNYDAPGSRVEKAHLLQTVINNIKVSSTYYQDATLAFTVKENDQLYQALKANKYFEVEEK